MKSYSDLEQSKKLAKILPIENADMTYMPIMDIDSMSNSGFLNIPDCYPFNEFKDCDTKPLPCWSLGALLDVLPNYQLQTQDDGIGILCSCNGKFNIVTADNPVDACVEMIFKLHELKLL